MQTIQEKVRDLLKTVREVGEWRDEYDPGTPEWHTLCDLSDGVSGLIFSLPPELLPEEEVRHPHPNEYAVLDELLSALGALDREAK